MTLFQDMFLRRYNFFFLAWAGGYLATLFEESLLVLVFPNWFADVVKIRIILKLHLVIS